MAVFANTRWHFIPRSVPLCVLNLVAGVLLGVAAGLELARGDSAVPALEIVVVVAAVALIACAIVGLAAPRLPGR